MGLNDCILLDQFFCPDVLGRAGQMLLCIGNFCADAGICMLLM